MAAKTLSVWAELCVCVCVCVARLAGVDAMEEASGRPFSSLGDLSQAKNSLIPRTSSVQPQPWSVFKWSFRGRQGHTKIR